jgi:ACR3 family arsenite efflux pump ArsB
VAPARNKVAAAAAMAAPDIEVIFMCILLQLCRCIAREP